MTNTNLGIQSWCFRGLKGNREIIDALRKCQVNRLEICGVHVDVNHPAETLKLYRDAGIIISSFGVNFFDTDEAACRKVFEFAVMADFPAISADLNYESLPLVEKLCSEYGKKIAIHNHGRSHALGSVRELETLFSRSSRNIGLCLDTAWMLDAGEDPVAAAEKFRERLYGLHVKDFIFDRTGTPEDVVVGTGNLKLDALAEFLIRTSFNGYLTLEYEGEVDNPTPTLSHCVKNINAAFEKTIKR